MPKIFWKLFLSLWSSIMLFAVVMAWISTNLVPQEPPDAREQRLSAEVERLQMHLVDTLREGDELAAKTLLANQPRHLQRHVLVISDRKELLDRKRARQLLDRRELRYRELEVASENGKTYTLLIVRPAPPAALLQPGVRGMLLRLLIAGAVRAIFSAMLAHYLSRPLRQLGLASRRLASGDLATRVEVPLNERNDEFGELARDLNEMARNLHGLQEANRNLLRDVSHELRSPLARIRVALELAKSRDSGQVSGELERLELESDRLEKLVDEVLDLLRTSSGLTPVQRENFDLCGLIQDVCKVVAYEVPEGSPGLQVRASPPLPISADRELMWRTVENLLRNALHHTDEHRGIVVTAALQSDGLIRLAVADRGPGLPVEQLERVFEPFYRAQEARDRASGGHGLGLAIAAAAVRRHQGHIRARNREDGGLEIEILIPGQGA